MESFIDYLKNTYTLKSVQHFPGEQLKIDREIVLCRITNT